MAREGTIGQAIFVRGSVRCALALLLCSVTAGMAYGKPYPADDRTGGNGPTPETAADSMPPSLTVVDGHDIRFKQLPESAGLSQTRVSAIAQDKLGFLWFGTQYGLNRYDGYKSKVFTHIPGNSGSLNCVYIRSLFVDHAGNLWVGCDRSLDKFNAATETFTHYTIDIPAPGRLPPPVVQVSEDSAGMLWLATARGLYKADPATGRVIRYAHDPTDPASIAGNNVKFSGEDRNGNFWVADDGGLDLLDRATGKVIRHVHFNPDIGEFHQDRSGVFWISSTSFSCQLATLDPKTGRITCHAIYRKSGKATMPVKIYSMLEARDGALWLATSPAGLLRLDRGRKQIVSYRHYPSDNDSLGSDNIICAFEDKEGDLWACLQEAQPRLFAETPLPFENFTYRRGSLINPLVTTIYEDRKGVLWIATMGGLNRIDRRAGTNTSPPGSGVGDEILSIIEDQSGVLLAGTYHHGLRRIDPNSGALSSYVVSRRPSNLAVNPVLRVMVDDRGTLWAATYGGVSRLDRITGNFITHTPDKQNVVQYNDVKEDTAGNLWLGGQTGLHRFTPGTAQFTVFQHDPGKPTSLSDNRVNSVHFDRSGNLWVGTQNGLDRFEPATGMFKAYHLADGLGGNVVSCILEDRRGILWMSTNNGISSFDSRLQRFQSFSTADGLPGPDMTGWGACNQSRDGEMFFGGFSGATAFYPDRIVDSRFAPPTVLTDFRLFGNPIFIGPNSPLRRSITYSSSVTLSHQQNILSLEFSALSYFSPETNRYRYRLDGLDQQWHEVGSNERLQTYTTLPARTYTFRVQGATSRGAWSEPGVALSIEVLPPWWETWYVRASAIAAFLALLWAVHQYRLRHIAVEFNARLEERTRIARELHDTLLQSFQGLLLRFQGAHNLLPGRSAEARQVLAAAIEDAAHAVTEAREAVQGLRSNEGAGEDLPKALEFLGEQLAREQAAKHDDASSFVVEVEGTPHELHPILRDEVYRIAREALRNAFHHSRAEHIEVEIRYHARELCVLVRDDGTGIEAKSLTQQGRPGHWGLAGMRERARHIGGQLEVWTKANPCDSLPARTAGTEVELRIPASVAYYGYSRRRFGGIPGSTGERS